ncbi:MAG: hypothetical protein LBS07_00180 [Prevotellaceae bacterium]|jgi:hypothetical protein|nr:hypothetical protein [Prevotellaceae bacterium]
MVYKFTVLSDESDDFIRIITIDSEAKFIDLHNAILDSAGYAKDQITSFFLCSDTWKKEQEVTLMEMESSSEYDNLTMDETALDELLTDEKQKLLYIFDMLTERAFYIELSEIVPRKEQSEAECILSKGKAPQQVLSEQDLIGTQKINLDENFYGDEEYDLDELDEEGFGDMNFDDNALFSEDPAY